MKKSLVNFAAGLFAVSIFGSLILLIYGLTTKQTSYDNLINLLLIAFIAIIIHMVVDKHKKNKIIWEYRARIAAQNEQYRNEPITEREQTINLALNDIETTSNLIQQYTDLYSMIENELSDTCKAETQRKLKKELINTETKIHKLETQRNKAYYIAYSNEKRF